MSTTCARALSVAVARSSALLILRIGAAARYLVNSRHTIAIDHNDDSVLERFHAASAVGVPQRRMIASIDAWNQFRAAGVPGQNPFVWMDRSHYQEVRHIIIQVCCDAARIGVRSTRLCDR